MEHRERLVGLTERFRVGWRQIKLDVWLGRVMRMVELRERMEALMRSEVRKKGKGRSWSRWGREWDGFRNMLEKSQVPGPSMYAIPQQQRLISSTDQQRNLSYNVQPSTETPNSNIGYLSL
ncbi:hypothetical protein ACH5RR_016150 [Cinchona calisaya]|uniref:Uncharacterized protein n=1 Tax=Cinchona calisaya TaxID=153742 RepID=A0ABD2ZX50_9GENT